MAEQFKILKTKVFFIDLCHLFHSSLNILSTTIGLFYLLLIQNGGK